MKGFLRKSEKLSCERSRSLLEGSCLSFYYFFFLGLSALLAFSDFLDLVSSFSFLGLSFGGLSAGYLSLLLLLLFFSLIFKLRIKI